MTNYYKRNRKFVGTPELMDPIEREYKTIWLQPISESQVPMEVYVYEKRDGWQGYRAADDRARMPEVFWTRTLWKEVPSPIPTVQIREYTDNESEDTLEVNPE